MHVVISKQGFGLARFEFAKSMAELKKLNTITRAKFKSHFEVLDPKIASGSKRRVCIEEEVV